MPLQLALMLLCASALNAFPMNWNNENFNLLSVGVDNDAFAGTAVVSGGVVGLTQHPQRHLTARGNHVSTPNKPDSSSTTTTTTTTTHADGGSGVGGEQRPHSAPELNMNYLEKM